MTRDRRVAWERKQVNRTFVSLGKSGGIEATAQLVDGCRYPLLYLSRGGVTILLGGREIERLRHLLAFIRPPRRPQAASEPR